MQRYWQHWAHKTQDEDKQSTNTKVKQNKKQNNAKKNIEN